MKICLLVDSGRRMPDWQKMLIDRILTDDDLDLCSVVEVLDGRPQKRASWLFATTSFIERKLFVRTHCYVQQQPYSENENLKCELDTLPETLERLNADIVINTSQKRLSDEALKRTTFGEWWFNFSECCDAYSDWFGYDAVENKAPTVELVLLARDSNGTSGKISSAYFNAKPSGSLNNATIKERAVTLLMRELNRVCRTGALTWETISPQSPVRPPTYSQTLKYAAMFLIETSERLVKVIHGRLKTRVGIRTNWILFTGQGSIENFNLASASEIPPAMDSIKADPFLFEYSGHTYLFYEAYSQGDSRAHIAVSRLINNELEELGPALQLPYHLSYPLVFSDGDDIFMLPETHHANRIEVWKCTEFPLEWERYSTAFDGLSVVDSVLTKFEDKWWLFTNMSSYHAHEDHSSELHVYQVDGPQLNRMVPHRDNPVVIGNRVARNGGRIIEKNGKLYRPTQHGEFGVYGYGLKIMEINRLTLDEYEEHCIRTIKPDFSAGIIGCHHFDSVGGRYIIDARVS